MIHKRGCSGSADSSPSATAAAAPAASRLRGVLDHLPDAVSVYDAQGRYEFVNSVGLRAIGRSLDELIGNDDEALFGVDEVSWFLPLLKEALATGIEQRAECAIDREGGQQHKIVTMSPVVDEGGAVRQVVATFRDDTQRKRAEIDREQMFAQSMSLMCIGGFDGYLKGWSPAWGRLLGYSHEEMTAMSIRELVHPEDWDHAESQIGRLQQGQSVSGAEVRVRCNDGSFKWVLWNGVPCPGQPLFFASGQDISIRKQLEEKFFESEQRFRLIAGSMREAVWDWDLRTGQIWRNEGYSKNFGAPASDAESIFEWWSGRIHPEDRERILASVAEPVANGRKQWSREYRLRRRDGTYAFVFDRGSVFCDEQGQPIRRVGSLIDISDLKNTEARLRESEERFQLAAKATRDAIWDWDLRKGTVWRSESFFTLFGYAAEDIDPDFGWWVDHIHEDDREQVLLQLPAFTNPQSQQSAFEYRFRRADGTYADVLDRGFVMFDHEGQPVRVIGTMMDISLRRQAEELAQMQRAELAHIARVSTMGEIATGLAHELNQPLTAIANYAESCMRALVSKSPRRDQNVPTWIEKIALNTHRAAEMIKRLRGFTRKSEQKPVEIDINELVDEVIDLLEGETRRRHVRLKWNRVAPLTTTVDVIQIQQVLVNLVRNAYEAMASKQPDQRQVTISIARQDGTVEVSVEDTGEGIAPADLERVFDAFFTSKPNGVGIGLAISRSIIEDHGGRLWVVPNPKDGVTFHFTLPLIEEGPHV